MKLKNNKIYPIIIFILLIFAMAYIPYIPVKLFKLDISSFSKSELVLYNFICDFIFMILIFIFYKKDLIKDFKDLKNNFSKISNLIIKYYFVGLFLMIVSNILISIFFKTATANNEETIREYLKLYPIYMIFSISLYAPFVEELIFRKAIKDCFLPYKESNITKYLYAITSGLIFSSMHVVGTTSNLIDYIYIIPYLSLGIAFALLYHKSNNIFSTIIIHCIHNTVTLLLYLMAGVV